MTAGRGAGWLASLGTLLVILLLVLFYGGAAAAGEARTALVIGNGAYSYGALPNPVNDATDVAAALHDAGFEVSFKKDADREAMVEAIHAFADTLRTKGGVGLFYFSGHGLQAESANYLLPIGQEPSRESDLRDMAINAGRGHVVDDLAGVDRHIPQIRLAARLLSDRQEIVRTLRLEAMP